VQRRHGNATNREIHETLVFTVTAYTNETA
jgi:hypothetical protein